MSTHVSSRVWKQRNPETRGHDLVLLLKLADNASDDGFCWPADQLLIDETGLEERQLRRSKRNLENLGEIAAVVGQGRGHVSVYHVLTGLSPEQRDAAIEALPLRAEELAEGLRYRRQKRGQTRPLSEDRKRGQIRPLSGEEKGTNPPPLNTEKGTNRVDKRGQIASIKGDNAISVEAFAMRSDPLNHHESVMEPWMVVTTTPLPPTPPDADGNGGGGGGYPPTEPSAGHQTPASEPPVTRTPSRAPAPSPEPSTGHQTPADETAAMLRAIRVRSSTIATLRHLPPVQVAAVIADARTRSDVRDLASWVVSALRDIRTPDSEDTAALDRALSAQSLEVPYVRPRPVGSRGGRAVPAIVSPAQGRPSGSGPDDLSDADIELAEREAGEAARIRAGRRGG